MVIIIINIAIIISINIANNLNLNCDVLAFCITIILSSDTNFYVIDHNDVNNDIETNIFELNVSVLTKYIICIKA